MSEDKKSMTPASLKKGSKKGNDTAQQRELLRSTSGGVICMRNYHVTIERCFYQNNEPKIFNHDQYILHQQSNGSLCGLRQRKECRKVQHQLLPLNDMIHEY